MKQRLWQVGFMLALFGMFLLGTAIGQGTGVSPVIKAQRFELVDEGGKVLASLKVSPKGQVELKIVARRGLMDDPGQITLEAWPDGSTMFSLDCERQNLSRIGKDLDIHISANDHSIERSFPSTGSQVPLSPLASLRLGGRLTSGMEVFAWEDGGSSLIMRGEKGKRYLDLNTWQGGK